MTIALTAALALIIVLAWRRTRRPDTREREEEQVDARVTPLEAPGQAPRVYGRAGDLVLRGSADTAITVAATQDAQGHRPLRGAILDVNAGPMGSDPILWWRPAWVDGEQKMHPVVASTVIAAPCPEGPDGVGMEGDVDGVHLATQLCALTGGRYLVTTTATGLPEDAVVADDLNTGIVDVAIDERGPAWEGDAPTRFVLLAAYGTGMTIEATGMRARGRRIRIADEIFPAPIVLLYQGAFVTRTVRVVRGDAFDALAALPFSTREATVGLQNMGGEIVLQDGAGHPLVRGDLRPNAVRTIHVPDRLGDAILVRDANGVPAPAPIPFAEAKEPKVVTIPSGQVDLRFTDGRGAPIAAHVLFRGLSGTRDPSFETKGRTYAGGRSVYLLDGEGSVHLAPGRYAVTATHGPTYSLVRRQIEVAAGSTQTLADTLKVAIDTSAWTGSDFHLHAAPSPDSGVSLEARLASLACEGVDLAVATDHNHVTDYAPVAHDLKITDPATVVGDEITSAGAHPWGHFNAFPLPPPKGASEDVIPAYYDILPADIFAGARDAGARVVQVNHPRMPPQIGYFELAHVDETTGHADPEFADDFDALEAYNGFWLEAPEKVREGARDLVAMARRGRRPIATGNSDSHRLLYEEAGYPRTYVHTPAGSSEDRAKRVIEAMLTGDTTVSSGPLVELSVDGKPPGTVLRLGARKEVHAHVRVSAPAWVPVESIEIWVDDRVAARFDAGPVRDGVRFERDVTLKIDADAVILAWAEAHTPLPDVMPSPNARAIGFTGLVYIDADGDGRVQVPPRRGALAP